MTHANTEGVRTWLVLAGGESTRFSGPWGRDKLRAPLGAGTVLEATLEALRRADPRAQSDVLGPEFSGGPARAVRARIDAVTTPTVGVLAGDMPGMRTVISALCSVWRDDMQALVPTDASGRHQWLCALYNTQSLRTAMHGASSDSWHSLMKGLTVTDLPMPDEGGTWDIDTVQDFEKIHSEWQDGRERAE